jgi:hypothetical protein
VSVTVSPFDAEPAALARRALLSVRVPVPGGGVVLGGGVALETVEGGVALDGVSEVRDPPPLPPQPATAATRRTVKACLRDVDISNLRLQQPEA